MKLVKFCLSLDRIAHRGDKVSDEQNQRQVNTFWKVLSAVQHCGSLKMFEGR